MTTKAHKNLTGSDLHEPKGADTATAGQVYAADGAGSGAWGKLTADNLTGTGNPFGAQLLHVRETAASSGNSSVSLSVTTWTRRLLNSTLTNEISSAGLGAAPASSNQILLPAGTYYAEGRGILNSSTSSHQVRFYDITHSTALVYGLPALVQNSQWVECRGRFTLSAQSVIELQHITGSINTGGSGYSLGGGEVFAEAMIWKVA